MKKAPLIIILSFLMTLLFQGCTDSLNFLSHGGGDADQKKSQLNGEGYAGKPSPYDLSIPNQPCLEKGANGKALPNAQIFIFPTGGAQLVREQCADITPKPLAPLDYTLAANGDIIYQNQTYASNLDQSPFDVVAASCPAGRSLLANPVRTSIALDSLDLQSSAWEHPALTITPEGSLASLPVYKIERTDPNALANWHRVAQSPVLKAGESYVFSFFVKTSLTDEANFIIHSPGTQDLEIKFDLVTGAFTTHTHIGVNLLSTSAQLFGGGLYINIYFQPTVDGQAGLGISSFGELLGSSISATAVQLEAVSNFCSP